VSTDVTYLDLDDLLLAAEAFLGRPAEVRDYGLLESAAVRPQATAFGEAAYPSLHSKAAALLSSLVRNHALVDGNQQLGLVATRLFYALNDHRFTATDDEKFELIMTVAEGRLLDVREIADRLAQFTSPHDA
jgi:death-on-curing protein